MTDAPLHALLGLSVNEDAVAELLGHDGAVVAVPESTQAYVLSLLAALSDGRTFVVTPTTADAERLCHDLGAFVSKDKLALFPAWETLPFERVSPAVETMGARLSVLDRLRRGDKQSGCIVVTPIKACLQRLGPTTPASTLIVRAGTTQSLSELAASLAAIGYRREYQVEHRGEFAVRGGILDVYPSTGELPVRIDCFGDEVERLTSFDVSDQRSLEDLAEVEIFGCREFLPDEPLRSAALRLSRGSGFAAEQLARLGSGELFDGMESLLALLVEDERLVTDGLGESDRLVLVEPRRLRDRAVELADEEHALVESLASTWLTPNGDAPAVLPQLHVPFDRLLTKCSAHVATILGVPDDPSMPRITASGWPTTLGDATTLARRVLELSSKKLSVVVACEGAGSADRAEAVLSGEGIELDRPDESEEGALRLRSPGVHLVVASLDRGFILESSRLAVLAESDLTGRRRPHRVPKARARPVDGFFDDLATGSYVVHYVHGVARYAGMVTAAIGGAERDYLLLEYRGGDKLYVPSDQIDTVTPYTGGESPTLNRLNGGEWQRQRARVRSAAQQIAQELVVLYQRRLAAPGHGFSPDTPWQAEFEAAFPYPETRDQLRAIEDVKADMEKPIPMDRLVCGDVGFGKTEVALRAAFKCVQDEKQAAVLVPTTLLARQHFQTFAERCAAYPVRVEMLSRFLGPSEVRSVLAGLADGSVDIVIGTHRLLGGDVSFKRLGLLVIDEEQRFGVNDKESLKALQVGVDVLTLSANPIPRTLEMALTGIRDLSVIDTPPAARQPILTYVGEEDNRAIAEAIRRELLREGQVFVVHNRVRDIERVAAHVRELVPEARVAVAHGQMDEGTLEQVVLDFSDNRYDVLVSTTIIESGIDMPTVNTLVVDRAELLGLGQLHQLRGRVGRAGARAYAYLFHAKDRVLTEEAYERLRTIGEHTELGSGFKIAMRDLEIRGAGNLLGRDQSGHIAAVGYDLYVRMVAEAVAELKGETVPEPAEIKLELPIDAHLPSDYIEREDLRLEAYRRLAAVRDPKEADDVEAEWLDRFGPLPAPAEALLSVARLRAECVRTGLEEVTVVRARAGSVGPGRPGEVVARLSSLGLSASATVRLRRLFPRAIYKESDRQLVVPLSDRPSVATDLVELVRALVPVEASAA